MAENRCGKVIDEVGGSLESIGPKHKRETELMKECEPSFNYMAMTIFNSAIVLRGMRWRH